MYSQSKAISFPKFLQFIDSIRSYVRFEKPNVLKELSVEAMLDASEIYDVSPFAPYADDKAIIKILF